eukprot:2878679-Amphidinium_carterae.1
MISTATCYTHLPSHSHVQLGYPYKQTNRFSGGDLSTDWLAGLPWRLEPRALEPTPAQKI